MATEPLPDRQTLRVARRSRALAAMESHDLDVLVLGRVANIRYVSGVPILWNAGTRPFGPGCVLVRSTNEVYLLSTWDEGVPEEITHDHLYGITWNPMNLVEVLKGIGEAVSPGRVGTDATSPLFAQLLPIAFPNADIIDATPALRSARRTKTVDEVEAIRTAVGVADESMAAAVAMLQPGVRQRELTAAFMDSMASHGVTTPATQDVARITSARFAGVASGDEPVEAGDLVTFDGGVVAGGYTGEVGRTWQVAPDGASGAVDGLYRRSGRLLDRLLGACRPGAAAGDLLDAYHAAGEPLPVRPIADGLGLGFDDPVIARDLPRTAADETLDPGVVMVLAAQVVERGVGSVTVREPVLINEDGPELLSTSPRFNVPEGART